MEGSTKKERSRSVEIRPMLEADVAAADMVMRIAFGTFLGLPEPAKFMGDASYVPNRFRADPSSAFTAVLDGRVVGSSFVTRWGSVGFFGPLTVAPDVWDAGIGRRLMDPIMMRFETWGVTHAGLFTFAHSAKHVGFYQTLGFWPGSLTAVMARETWPSRNAPYSIVRDAAACRRVADAQYSGLDLTSEIEATSKLGLGETVMIEEGADAVGFAVCHVGSRTEAGSGACYVKFGAVNPGAGASQRFERLLDACAAYASSRDAKMLIAGMSTARHEAYRILLARGFRTMLQGVAMHRPNVAAYSRPELFVIDDWR
jgi:N-acetylglutamate synthase-like GNAT family acetyltransferase